MAKFRIPGLQVPSSADGETRAFFEALKERLELAGGERGDPEQRAVSLRELREAGIAIRTQEQRARIVTPRAPNAGDGESGEITPPESLDFMRYPQVALPAASGDLQLLVQGTTPSDRFRLSINDLLTVFGRLDQESTPQYPWSWESENYGFDIAGPAPRFRFVEQAEESNTESALPLDSAIWDAIANAGVFEFRVRNDDDDAGSTAYAIGRTGLDVDYFNVYADTLGISNGSASLPGLSFVDASGTGVFLAGADTLGLATASNVRLQIDAGGAFGLNGANYGTARQFLSSNGPSNSPTWEDAPSPPRGATFTVSSGPLTLPVGDVKVRINKSGTISKVTLMTAGGNGSCIVDIWKAPFSSYPPTAANSICGATKPTIIANNKYEDSILSGWTTSVAAGDVLVFHLLSTSVFSTIFVQLDIT
jgi:hypothetical protein